MQETWVQSLGWEDPLDMGMDTHSSILAWGIPCTDKPGELQDRGVTESDATECLLHWESPCLLDCKLHEGRTQVVETLSSLYHWCLAPGNNTC